MYETVRSQFEAFRKGGELYRSYGTNPKLLEDNIAEVGKDYSRLQQFFLRLGVQQSRLMQLEEMVQQSNPFH